MNEVRAVHCGGAASTLSEAKPLVLNLQGSEPNVFLKIGDISEAMARDVPHVLMDLIEVAAYVFSADQGTKRGDASDTGDAWRRRFRFHIPVRLPEIWSRDAVTTALTDVLSFLSDDSYEFVFSKLDSHPAVQLYFEQFVPDFAVDEVALFSGGLDSLAGSIQEALIAGNRVALVSHDSATKRKPQITALAAEVAKRAKPGTVRHVPVLATKAERVTREYTQRSRSFLYSALGATIASMLGRDRIRFYENGVTSHNLPIAPQVVGGRATRTTHPQVIQGYSRLFSTLLERPFAVESPFLWKTKADVIRLIKDSGCGPLIASSISCSKTIEATTLHTHCGRCSQCIDRRFATLAAGATDDEDPPEMYKVDLLTDERTFGENRTMAESFVQRAARLRSIHELDFFAEYPEATRSLRHVGLTSEEAAARIVELHRRHGREVFEALAEGHKRYAREFQEGKLPDSCLLVLAIPGRYREASDKSSPAIPTFKLETDFWKVWFENERVSLKNDVGLRHIARLLASPGRDWHSADLRAQEAGHGGFIPLGSAGEASDRVSIRQYRARLESIPEELADAEGAGDVHRQVELRQEGEQISKLLAGVTDNRGRPRRAADDAETARQAVSAAVRRAMKKLMRKHLPLWRHLSKHMKIGLFCCYRPEPPIDWITG